MPSRARSRRCSGVKVSRLPTRLNTPLAFSATRPVSSPFFLKNRPSGGSGVSFVMPASSSALLLYQLVWPPRCATTTGCSVVASSRSFFVSGRSSFVSSNWKPLIHKPGGGGLRLPANRGVYLAHRLHVRVDAVQLLHAAWMAVTIDEPRRHEHLLRVDHARARRRDVAKLARRSDRDETAVLHGERFCARARRIAREHARVDDDEIGLDAGPAAEGGCSAETGRPNVGTLRRLNAPASAAPKPRNSPRVYLAIMRGF